MGNDYWKRIKNNIDFLLADTARSRAAPAIQQPESVDMEDVNEYIRNDLKRLNGNSAATSGSSRPSLPVEPSPETFQQPDRDRDTAPKVIHFSEESAFVAPVASTSSASVGASRSPYPSNEPYRVMVEEPVSSRSDVVAPGASTSRASAGTSGVSRQASNKPHVKNVKKSQNRRSEVVVPVTSTSRGCAGVGSVSRQENNAPTVEIVEQPMRSRRFRYDCDIKSAGAIQGVQSTKDQKSFPKIKIGNYVGLAQVTVSLVSKDAPYRVHPNGIVSKNKSSSEDMYIYVKHVQIRRNNCVIQFDDLGIRIVKPDQIEGALRLREEQNVDPFGQGFSHKFDLKINDLQAVRLCFQVKLAQEHKLDPVVSDVIYHSKNVGCLRIDKVILMCRCQASNTDETVIFMSQQLNPKDVEVVFYQEENGEVWQHCVREFDICDTRGIVCAVPPYPRSFIEYNSVVNVVLRRPSDGTCGDPKPFTYCANTDAIIERKRKKANNIVQYFVKNNWTPSASLPPANDSQYDQDWRNMPGPFDVNPTMPGPSAVNQAVPGPGSVNPAVPGPSTVNPAVLRLSYVNSAMPEPSFANQALPRPSFTNPAVPGSSSVNPAAQQSSANAAESGLNHVNSAKPRPGHVVSAMLGPSFINQSMPWRSYVNPAMPGPSSVNAGVLGPNHIKLAVPEPGFVNSAVPGLNYVNAFSPEPTEWEPMQTNLSMSPDMVPMPSISHPMLVTEDESLFSPNGHLDIHGEYPGEDSAPADVRVCYNLINI